MKRIAERCEVVLGCPHQEGVAVTNGIACQKVNHVLAISTKVNGCPKKNLTIIVQLTHPFDRSSERIEFSDVVGAETKWGVPELGAPPREVEADAGATGARIAQTPAVGVAYKVIVPRGEDLMEVVDGIVLSHLWLVDVWRSPAQPRPFEKILDLSHLTSVTMLSDGWFDTNFVKCEKGVSVVEDPVDGSLHRDLVMLLLEDPPPHIPERVVEDNRSLCAGGMLQMW